MAEGREEFERQLRALGYEPDTSQLGSRVAFDYIVTDGRFNGQKVKLGLEVPLNFPLTPPGGPHISPRLLPLNPQAPNHPDRTAESIFGADWQYWSRPYPPGKWKGREGVAQYMVHIGHLFCTT